MRQQGPDDLRLGTARIRTLTTGELRVTEITALRALMDVAFGDDPDDRFRDEDWAHAIGGRHVVMDLDGVIIGHASVVERELQVAGRSLRTGYVEAVAVQPALHGRGLGSRLMTVIDDDIRDRFEFGALGTGRQAFYERLGWRTWRGPTSVRTASGDRRTPDEDGNILVFETPATPTRPLDIGAPISCDWREGNVW